MQAKHDNLRKTRNGTQQGEKTDLLKRLREYANGTGLTNKELAETLHIRYKTLIKWWFFTNRKDPCYPSEASLSAIRGFLCQKPQQAPAPLAGEASRKARKVKYLLILLEDELAWFKDNGPEARNQFRKELDPSDVGYISSLLGMLNNEEKFSRWLTLTTARFHYFGKEGSEWRGRESTGASDIS